MPAQVEMLSVDPCLSQLQLQSTQVLVRTVWAFKPEQEVPQQQECFEAQSVETPINPTPDKVILFL